ncbi:hepatitis A virus cellular receptor 1 homolog [Stegastes partitus]|uniref:Hepatitis A virus cellular receptor 1 homolog n=1 Tax=Stegastes partitus TaxID=144197 RepID=A0A9Y4JUN5_9TELE|nr:PREDICTED: hepatitis A virus cellular receptor 1 homolog [Stegastes partitus]
MRGLSYFFLLILSRASSATFKVIGLVGHNVTLPCVYDAQTHGVLSFCWGQEKVPRSKCSSTILSSQDGAVSFRQSPRYQLPGRVTDGDASLTIVDAQWADAGVYGCRVEIPGWFNDYKVNIQLLMEEAPVEPPVQSTLSTAEGKGDPTETPTTFETKNVEDDEPTWTNAGLTGSVRAEEKFKGFLAVGNIGRVTAIFFFPIIIILVFIFRRMFLSRDDGQRLNTVTAENIYESMPVP